MFDPSIGFSCLFLQETFDPDGLVPLTFLQDTAQHKFNYSAAVAVRDISVMDPGSEPLSQSRAEWSWLP